MSRLKDGFFVSADGAERFVYSIVNGSMYQVEAVNGLLADLAPGYYDRELNSVDEEDAVGKGSVQRIQSRRMLEE